MTRRHLIAALVLSLFVCTPLLAKRHAIGPIVEVAVTPNGTAFEAAERTKPIEIRSKEDAAKYFSGKSLKLLSKIDFKKQIVLVFAWRGSGGDRLDYVVAESYPEQIFFTLTGGRTRDLRSHTAVYALRSNVKWSVK
jgi:hypothetical protein